jgi:hypothetical protein
MSRFVLPVVIAACWSLINDDNMWFATSGLPQQRTSVAGNINWVSYSIVPVFGDETLNFLELSIINIKGSLNIVSWPHSFIEYFSHYPAPICFHSCLTPPHSYCPKQTQCHNTKCAINQSFNFLHWPSFPQYQGDTWLPNWDSPSHTGLKLFSQLQ